MKRIVDYFLLHWKSYQFRKPLIVRGARQIGKTFTIRQLGKTFEHFIEINFDTHPQLGNLFTYDLDPHRIIQELSLQLNQQIIPGKTLLFFDEIQQAPQAIAALRYFYEMMPELHVIAAGSLLDFAVEKHGLPVGRIQSFYMYPLSFIEYLVAIDEKLIAQAILQHNPQTPIFASVHEKTLRLLSQYFVLGGMPEVIQAWLSTHTAFDCHIIQQTIIETYQQDFGKYARVQQIKYVEKIFQAIALQLGQKFKYHHIEGDYRKRELAPALDLLVTAGIAYRVYYTTAQGFPLGFQTDLCDYKVISLDPGLNQAQLQLNTANWFLNPTQEFINKGALVEAFVGQEYLKYSSPRMKHDLYYWHKDAAPNQAEIDYIFLLQEKIIPIEVKSGDGRTLKSMHNFLATHSSSPYGIKFSTQNYSIHDKIHAYPLYAIVQPLAQQDPEMIQALESLLA